MRIVVTGGSGMLGHCLMRLAQRRHEVWGSYHTHPVEMPGCSMFAMDVTDEAAVRTQLEPIKPDVVIHTAALTDVDECERAPEKAKRINSEGTKIAARVAEALGAALVFISSDYVFDGAKGNYDEQDHPSPVNCYGESKLLGEEYARQFSTRLLILRTTMFGLKIPPRIGLMETLVEALRCGKPLSRFTDHYFTPLYTRQFSELILRLAELKVMGLFHVGAMERVSRFQFAQEVAEIFAPAHGEIRPVPFRQIDGLARRPQDTSLVSRLIVARLGIQLPDLRAGLLELKQDWQTMMLEGIVSQ